MTTRDKMDFLHGIIAELLGLPGKQVVWVDQNMPRIKRPFATLQFYGVHGEASEELRPTGPGKYDVRVPTSATLAVQYFGPDPWNTWRRWPAGSSARRLPTAALRRLSSCMTRATSPTCRRS